MSPSLTSASPVIVIDIADDLSALRRHLASIPAMSAESLSRLTAAIRRDLARIDAKADEEPVRLRRRVPTHGAAPDVSAALRKLRGALPGLPLAAAPPPKAGGLVSALALVGWE